LPKTKKQEEMAEMSSKIMDADSLQRYFLLNHSTGRNNAIMRYSLMLIDNGGHSSEEAILLARDFNSKLPEPLSDKELSSTVFKTIYKREVEREMKE